MDLQNTFYALGIVFMSISILIFIAMVTIVFYLKRKVDQIHREIDERMEDFNVLVANPVKRAARMASNLMPGRSKREKD